jgi:sulfate permease, SulP family
VSEITDVKAVTDEINEESDMIKDNTEHLTIPEGVEVYEINVPGQD